MARPKKHTVDYFPHDCHHSKEIEILLNKFGNVGYAFYYRLMEVIGKTPSYTVDYSDSISIHYLSTQTGTDVNIINEIIPFLVELKVIDKEIWEKEEHIWCQEFVDSIKDVYRKRKDFVPDKYYFIEENKVSGAGNEQSKLKERKRKKRKEEKNSSLFEVELQKWTQTDSSVSTDSKSKRIEKTKIIHCPNGHGKKECPESMIPHMFCSKCEEPLLEEYMLPYHPKKGSISS